MALLPMPFNNPRTYDGHGGVDFAQSAGTPILASGDGVVYHRNHTPRGGYQIWVRYDLNGKEVGYAHMPSHAACPQVGTRVSAGSTLGVVGYTGRTIPAGPGGAHLHIEINGDGGTAGVWRAFDRNRVVGAAPAGGTSGGSGMWDVEKRQRFLNQIGLDTGGVGNGWGAMSDSALKTFQGWMGLDPDGDWGTKTQTAAELIMAGGNFTSRPVSEIQTFLKGKGLYSGAIDNEWGNGSSMGTYRYQRSVGLTADAQWGAATDAKAFPPAPKPDPVPPTGTVLDPAAPWKKQTPDSSLATWVGSPNYNNSSSGQGAKTKTHIDHHWFGTDASLAGTDAHFQNPGTVKNGRGTGASSQYGIGADGTVHQYVLDKDYAHTNGTYEANATGITIEHEGGPGKPVTEATIQRSAELHADIARRHGWAKLEWMVNVFPHKHYVATQCPGTLPSEEIIRRANLLLNPAPGTVVVAKTELMALRAQIEAQQKTLGALAATVTGWLS